jgi:hypothetical protein
MKILRALLALFATFAVLGSITPSLVFAQYYPTSPNNNYCNGGYTFFGTNTNLPAQAGNCTPGTLLVYVQVSNNTNGQTRNPQDFTVTVSGNNPSPTSFPGSLAGTFVSVGGGYNVVAMQLSGYTPTYSTGCSGTLSNNQQALCIITESASYPYYNTPVPYPYTYPYANSILACTPATQTVGFRQTATFTATGGSAPYTWATSNQTYQGIGPVLNVTLPTTGQQSVTVSAGGQMGTCTVNVVPGVVPANPQTYPTALGTIPVGVTLSQVSPPTIPNTGYEPMSSASIAFAVVSLITAAFIALKYVRSAFAYLLG